MKTRAKFLPFILLAHCPAFLLQLISNAVFVILFKGVKYRRNIVADNLRKAFPQQSTQDLNTIEEKYFKHFSTVYFDALKIFGTCATKAKKHIVIKNPELLDHYYTQKRSIILYAAHFGNWEINSTLPLHTQYTVNAIYQKQSNKYFEELILLIRQKFGVNCIESARALRELGRFNAAQKPTLNIIISDQSPTIISEMHWCNFLNQNTPFLTGAYRIAEKTNQVLLYPHVVKIAKNRYEIEFKLISEKVHKNNKVEIIDLYAKYLEESIANDPSMWLWSHRRWKLQQQLSR